VLPQEHVIPVYLRGVFLHGDKRFCFVAYHDNEQEEAGDTYEHTFTKEPWAHCETRWFYFHGEIDATPSPSTSPIFSKHRIAPEWVLLILEPWQVDAPIPDMTLIILEPWQVDTTIPDMTLIILEPWHVDTSIPDMTRIILEPWTVDISMPDMTRIILEEWT